MPRFSPEYQIKGEYWGYIGDEGLCWEYGKYNGNYFSGFRI